MELRSGPVTPQGVDIGGTSLLRRRPPELSFARALVVIDALAVALAFGVAYVLRAGVSGEGSVEGTSLSYVLVAVLAGPLWLALTVLSGGYEVRVLGIGADEYRRVLNVGLRFFALVAILVYLTDVEVSRAFVVTAVSSAAALTMFGRYRARKWLHDQRARGRGLRRVLAVGTIEAVSDLARHLYRTPHAGFRVVGVCVPGGVNALSVDEADLPVEGGPDQVRSALLACRADVVAVAGEGGLPSGGLRALAWELEGSGVELIVAPAVTDVAGPRIAIRPVAGLPLLHVEEPRFSGAARLFKGCFDRLVAAWAWWCWHRSSWASAFSCAGPARGRPCSARSAWDATAGSSSSESSAPCAPPPRRSSTPSSNATSTTDCCSSSGTILGAHLSGAGSDGSPSTSSLSSGTCLPATCRWSVLARPCRTKWSATGTTSAADCSSSPA